MVKFCPKCGCETERHAGGDCKPCSNALSAAWRARNPDKAKANDAAWRAKNADRKKAMDAAYRVANLDKVKERKAAWYAKNRDRMNAKSAAYYSANADKVKAVNANYRNNNPGKVKACKDAWYAANPERVKSNKAAWLSDNPEAVRIHSQNRRARVRAADGQISVDLTAKLFKLQKGKCPCCQKPLGKRFHLDHILPLKLGGSNTDGNMQLLRPKCNLSQEGLLPLYTSKRVDDFI